MYNKSNFHALILFATLATLCGCSPPQETDNIPWADDWGYGHPTGSVRTEL
jgi:hypothetical protein